MGFNSLTIGLVVIMIGLFGVLTRKNLIKLVMSLYIMNSGAILFFVSLGYIKGGQAAIYEDGTRLMVDPLPQAVMLTSIVIGLVITSLALALAMKIYDEHKTLNIGKLVVKHHDN
ncbi:MAG: cation:proton antiporter subunit C [bacterium]